MLMTKIKFAADCINHFFEKKITVQLLKLTQERKLNYEKNNPLDWEEDRCVICDFPLDVKANGIEAGPAEMTYYDFIITKVHKFLQNIIENEEL